MLRPEQIGVFAGLVKKAIDENPIVESGVDSVDKTKTPRLRDNDGMEAWEKALKESVDACETLPSYSDLERSESELSEFLTEYY